MTRFIFLRVFSAVVLVAGFAALPSAHTASTDGSAAILDGDLGPERDQRSTRERALAPGDSMVLDVSALVPLLDSLRVDEREEQMADWAVYGTLFNAPGNAEELREAMYDKVPLRIRGLDAAANFDYGPGRRVIRRDGAVWLFYAAAAPRTATLGRLADQVRMELGTVPDRFAVFRVQSDVAQGVITVQREPDVGGDSMFSPEFGYVASVVRTLDDLRRWVDSADDVTHVRMLPDGVEIGGRRFAEARTAGISIDDLGALYQAHTTLEQRNRESDDAPKTGPLGELTTAWSDLIAIYNLNVAAYNRSGFSIVNGSQFAVGIARVRSRMSDDRAAPAGPARSRLRIPTLIDSAGISAGIFGIGEYSTLESQKAAIEALEPEVGRRVRQLWKRELALRARNDGWRLASEPGFSLDPEWDGERLAADLQRLAHDPGSIIAEAAAIAARTPIATEKSVVTPMIVRMAHNVASVFKEGGREFHVQPHWRQFLARADGDAGDEGIAVLFLLDSVLAAEGSRDAGRMSALVDYVRTRNAFQCARYDGPLFGTRVGMVLFYTDLMAKVWSIDYGASAPSQSVFGFLSALEAEEEAEPVHWPEERALPSTRIWFGTKKDAYASRDDDRELNFAHIATRVYSAGSNPTSPGEETETSEIAGRDIRWWDAHFAQIADYEQMYHLQNEIMKWSVITGMLAEGNRLRALDTVVVDHSLRFDRWYANESGLQYRQPLRMLPQKRWPGRSECLEVLQSRVSYMAGRMGTLSGGVSLGSRSSIAEGTRITGNLPRTLHRGGIKHEGSNVDEVLTLRDVRYRLPEPVNAAKAGVEIVPTKPIVKLNGSILRTEHIASRFETGRAGSAWHLETSGEALGRLSVKPTDIGARIAWREGPATLDRQIVDQVARKISLGRTLPEAAAQQAGAVPAHSTFVVANEQGVYVITGSGRLTGTPPRALRLGVSDAVPSEGSGISVGSFSPLDVLLGRAEARIVTGWSVDAGEAVATLNATKWQRVQATAGGGGGKPPTIERLFTNELPDGGRPIKIETGRADLATIDARVVDDAVYLERPANKDLNAAFNEFVFEERLSVNQLGRIVADSKAGAVNASLSAPNLRRPLAEVIGDHIVDGDIEGMLRTLARAASRGDLESGVTGLRQYVIERGFEAYGAGRPSSVAKLFLKADPASAHPDELLYRSLSHLQDGNRADAARSLVAATDRAMPSEGAMLAFEKYAARHGDDGAASYLRGRRAGFDAGRGGGKDPQIALTGERFRLQTTLDLPQSTKVRRIDASERSRVLADAESNEGIFYFDRAARLERDPDPAPGPIIAEPIRSPRVDIYEVLDVRVGIVAPQAITHQGRTLQRVGTASIRTPRVYIVRPSCDEQDRGRDPSCVAA